MNLDIGYTFTIELADAAATNQLPWHISWKHVPQQDKEGTELDKPAMTRGLTNDATAVTMIPTIINSPAAIDYAGAVNRSTTTETVIFATHDGSNQRQVMRQTLNPNQSVFYQEGDGWGIAGP